MTARGAVAVLLASACATAGCGGDDASAPAPPAPERGAYVGRSAGGVGASVDFAGFDPTARALERALGGDGVEIGIASVVNDSSEPVPTPRFVALGPDGRALTLTPARTALGDRPGSARARALLPPERRTLAGDGSAVLYLVLRRARAEPVAAVRMRVGAEPPVDLRPR